MSFDEKAWISDIEPHILRGYDDGRMIHILCSHPQETNDPIRILSKIENPTPARISFGWEQFNEADSITSKAVEAKHITHLCNMSKVWHERDNLDLSHYWYQAGQNIAMQEYSHIVKSMFDSAKNRYSYDTEQFQVEQIVEGTDGATGVGTYPRDMVVNRKDIQNIRTAGDLNPPRNFPEDYIPNNIRGRNFQGMIHILRVYHAPFLQNHIVIYDKNEIQAYTTPISFSFTKRTMREGGPYLRISKYCTSEPLVDSAVSVLSLDEKTLKKHSE